MRRQGCMRVSCGGLYGHRSPGGPQSSIIEGLSRCGHSATFLSFIKSKTGFSENWQKSVFSCIGTFAPVPGKFGPGTDNYCWSARYIFLQLSDDSSPVIECPVPPRGRYLKIADIIEVLFVKQTLFILILFASLPDCSQNQTAVSDTLRLLSDF
jgi:hypothetical protein